MGRADLGRVTSLAQTLWFTIRQRRQHLCTGDGPLLRGAVAPTLALTLALLAGLLGIPVVEGVVVAAVEEHY